ncbi:MAG: VWA domain-containing protein [Bryobacterales bacterium]|nr:VWA domain-containing protein [Bryobacterales bacterium]
MSDFRFGDVVMLHGLWLLPVLAALMLYAARRRRRALLRFVEAGLLARSGGPALADPARRVLKAALLLAALGCLIVALARPAWDQVQEEVVQRGRDVVFLLDVSRSMLAQDLPPNRLERAKLAIRDTVDQLQGDRVALAVFAGSTVVKCPLTLDYGFFRMALADVSPYSVSRGGTLIGDGIRKVISDVFDQQRSNYRDIVLITDGEDHESFPVEAAAQAGEQGVRLIAIGLGDERVGQRIPVMRDQAGASAPKTFLQHQGQEVWSRLDAATLREMADATPGGVYLNVATGAVDLGEVYLRLIASAEGQEVGSQVLERVEEKFQIFLVVCVLLLFLDIALRERGTRRAPGLAPYLLVVLALPAIASAASVRGLVNDGNESYRAEVYDEALEAYDQALEQDPGSPYASLSRAAALYRSGQFADAADAYLSAVRQSLQRGLPQIESAGLHSLGNALYRQAEEVAQTSPGQAVDHLERASRAYSDALRVDRGRSDSAHNLELARRLIQQLRDQASQQSQQGQGDEQGDSQPTEQDRSDALSQAADEQERLADASEQLERDRQEDADEDSRRQQQQRAQDLAGQQEKLNQRTEQLAENLAPEAQDQVEEASRHQQEAQTELDQNRPGAAEDEQRQAADALRRAAQAEAGRGSDEAQQPEPGDQPVEQAGGEAQTQTDPAEQMTVEQILAKEQQDRRDRQLQRVGVVAVEKDW